MRLLTIGFTRKSAEHFFEALRNAKARRVVDVRLNNISQLSGFTKKKDLEYFLANLCQIDYVHMPVLAPTRELIDNYKRTGGRWKDYERSFRQLMADRRIAERLNREMLEDACLLCSEDAPHHCHRRLIAEWLKEHWGDVEIQHLR